MHPSSLKIFKLSLGNLLNELSLVHDVLSPSIGNVGCRTSCGHPPIAVKLRPTNALLPDPRIDIPTCRSEGRNRISGEDPPTPGESLAHQRIPPSRRD